MAPKERFTSVAQFQTSNTYWKRFGKLIGRTSSVPQGSPLLEINAKLGATKLKFIVDTGASISILPTSAVNGITLNLILISLSTANGEKIKCYGQASLEIGIPVVLSSADSCRNIHIYILDTYRRNDKQTKKTSL